MSDRPARTIARALATASVYYKRTSLLAAVVALAAVVGTVLVEATVPKAAMLGVGVVFTVFAYRSLKASQRFVDPKASPVLVALTERPDSVAKIFVRHKEGQPGFVVIEDAEGSQLEVRVDPADVAERVPALLAALEARSPDAIIQGP